MCANKPVCTTHPQWPQDLPPATLCAGCSSMWCACTFVYVCICVCVCVQANLNLPTYPPPWSGRRAPITHPGRLACLLLPTCPPSQVSMVRPAHAPITHPGRLTWLILPPCPHALCGCSTLYGSVTDCAVRSGRLHRGEPQHQRASRRLQQGQRHLL